MKAIAKTMAALLCFALLQLPAFAEEQNASPPKPPHQGTAGMGDMSGMNQEQMDAHMRQVQETMIKHHDFMHQIRDAKDEKERSRLKDEWLNAMKHSMKLNRVPPQLMMHGMPAYNAPNK